MGDLYDKLAASHPSLTRGQVWCRKCGNSQAVNSATALANGWPKCCGYTMTIDSPEEHAWLAGGKA
jgi:Zn finger protein HypA/HybF involved in hydrogenase expression